jgi:hypothetical protein
MVGRGHRYRVNVLMLGDAVWNETRFRRANADDRFEKSST